MYLEILDERRNHILREIVEKVDIGVYYMAGGTALALQLGHRKSVDFDFFVPHKFHAELLLDQLKNLNYPLETINVCDGTCDVLLDGVQVSFFYYPQKMLRPYVEEKEWEHLRMAGLEDIAVMKAVAIGSRGAKKDFFDLYHILHRMDFGIKDLVDGLFVKFGEKHDFSYIGMGLNYFEDAETEILPETFVKYNWKEIKKYFSEIQEPFFTELRLRSRLSDPE
ncbi:MAG: nucleotidyl transferase AbiEii/AbiGii toxin family protein [Lachnospiraceae bacterium]|nr:nucleotidyl transferase AbiEii/AbiGii toxin family protein [Lachnospiraceae bacterium]